MAQTIKVSLYKESLIGGAVPGASGDPRRQSSRDYNFVGTAGTTALPTLSAAG